MRKFTANIVALTILFIVGVTGISTLLFLAAGREESERLARVEQEQALQTFWKLLRAKGTDFRIVNGKLMAGNYALNGNFELPDTIQSIFGNTATVFMGNTRISTNIRKEDGTRAVGTKLSGPAYDAIFKQNRPYRGEALILDIPYFTAYDPIRDSRGETIGVLYVGIKKNEFFSRKEHYRSNIIAGTAVVSTIFSILAIAILRDRKRQAEAIQESEAKYRILFEGSSEGILLLNDIIFDCNEQLCRLFGTTRDEIIGRPPLHFSPDLQPDGTPSADKARQVMESARAGEARFFPWQHRKHDGTLIETEVSLKALNIHGRTVLQAVVRDVSEKKKADTLMHEITASLRLSEERYRTVFESTGTAMVIIEEDATIALVNNEFVKLSGSPREEVEGKKKCLDFVGPDFRDMMNYYHRNRRISPDNTPSSYEFDFIDKSGGKRRILTTVKLIPGTSRSVASYMDITPIKRAERLLTGERCALELVNSDTSLEAILEYLCRLVEEQAHELRCSILLVDTDGRHLRHGAAPSLPLEYNRTIDGTRIGLNIGSCGTAAFTGEQVISGDIGTDPRWAKYRDLPLKHGLQACWSTPIKASGGTVIGTFAAYSTVPREPAGDELTLLERLGHLASIAIERKQTEESLRMARHQQQAMLDNIPDMVWLKDRESRFIAVNAALAKACGALPSEVVGKTDFDFWPPDLATLYREDDARVMASAKQVRTEEPLIDAMGKKIWIETIKMPVFDNGGTVIGTTGIARDISQRREAELRLRENEARLAKAQQIAHVGNWDWDICNDTVQFSDELFRIFRIPPRADLTYDSFLGAVHPDDRPAEIAAVNGALHDKAPYGITYRIICPGGEIRHLRAEGEVEFDNEGSPVRMQGIVRDITESTLAEAALRESEARFREIFEQNEDAIILLARESLDIIDANRASEALIGRDKEALAWLGPWSFIVPEDYNTFIGSIPSSLDTTPFHLERIGVVRVDGQHLITSIWGKIIRLRETEVVYCSIRDITQRIRMEEEAQITQSRLIHANKMTSLGVLVSGIAHEINNPNTFIQGNASLIEGVWRDTLAILESHRNEHGEFILGGLPFDEVMRIFPRLIHGVKEGSRRISAIISNLKDFAREDTIKTFVPVNINRIVEDAKLILTYQIHRHTDNFRLELAEDLPFAKGKPQQIEQVIINLIINALQALPGKDAGVTVTTATDLDASAITITIGDEGKGMPREILERITEPFFSTRLDQGGTGLGLSISAAIIREHNGTLKFESTPGSGTTATVSLPIANDMGD